MARRREAASWISLARLATCPVVKRKGGLLSPGSVALLFYSTATMGVHGSWQAENVKHRFGFVCCGLLGFQGDRANICLMSRLVCEVVEMCTIPP